MSNLRRCRRFLVVAAAMVLAAACGRHPGIAARDHATIRVSSTALEDGGDVPVRFTCTGEDVPPDLAWSEVPTAAVEAVVVVDDPDAPGGTFTHWTVWGLRPTASLPDGDLPAGAVEGTNDFGQVGYRGPCPPKGDGPHHYRFRVLVLDAPLDLAEHADVTELSDAIDGHVIAAGRLQVTYAR